jgi:LytS/YehU family sensor histidine kinase
MGQISPHFFFNSLNSLSMLVREQNEEKALAYIDQLSYTFRYIIQNGQNTKTTLADEMEFTRAYGELFKVRYADILFFDIDIDPKYNEWTLPALTMQPLIGNAVKHNTITTKHPLRVVIRVVDGVLEIENMKNPKLDVEPSTGIGLQNLRSRWQIIAGSDIDIIDQAERFVVRLPLESPKN